MKVLLEGQPSQKTALDDLQTILDVQDSSACGKFKLKIHNENDDIERIFLTVYEGHFWLGGATLSSWMDKTGFHIGYILRDEPKQKTQFFRILFARDRR